jgi:thioredoxin-dependent peroxiredoxin
MTQQINFDNLPQLNVGDIAPDFTAKTQKGEEVKLSDLVNNGGKALLIFYPGDDTPGCTTQLCGIRDVYKEYKDLGVTVLGVNHGNDKSHQKFIDKYSFPFDIIIDEEKKISTSYGQLKKFFAAITIKRAAYLIGEDRKILFVHQGQQDNQKIITMLKNQ